MLSRGERRQRRKIEEERSRGVNIRNSKQSEPTGLEMEEMKQMMKQLLASNQEIKQEIVQLRNEYKKKEEKWEEEKKELRATISDLQNRMENMEKEKRKKNIIIKGTNISGKKLEGASPTIHYK